MTFCALQVSTNLKAEIAFSLWELSSFEVRTCTVFSCDGVSKLDLNQQFGCNTLMRSRSIQLGDEYENLHRGPIIVKNFRRVDFCHNKTASGVNKPSGGCKPTF